MNSSSARRVIPYVVVLVIASYLCYVAFQISPAGNGQLGADFWPKTILSLTILTCIWEVARQLYTSRTHIIAPALIDIATNTPPETNPESPPDNVGVSPFAPSVGIGTTVIYVLLFPKLGYFLATFLYVTAFIYLGNYRRLLVALSVAFVASLAFMFIFMRVVYVSLPIGVDPFSRVSTFIMDFMGIR